MARMNDGIKDIPIHRVHDGLSDSAQTPESAEVDLELIDSLLALTPGQRLRCHAEFLAFAQRRRQALKEEYGFDPWDIRVVEEAE